MQTSPEAAATTLASGTVDELHPDGEERPSEKAMRLADEAERKSTRKRGSTKRATAKRGSTTPASSSSSDGKRVSGRQAIINVLADGKPRKAKDITAAAVKLIRPKPAGKTPEATLSALLYTQAKKPDGIVVRTKKPGEFKLRQPVQPKTKS